MLSSSVTPPLVKDNLVPLYLQEYINPYFQIPIDASEYFTHTHTHTLADNQLVDMAFLDEHYVLKCMNMYKKQLVQCAGNFFFGGWWCC